MDITYDNEEIGSGGAGAPVFSATGRPLRLVGGVIDFDDSYPTGGESIASIFEKFSELKGIVFEQKPNRIVVADYDDEKVLLYTALGNEAANESDQSTITGVRFLAWGYSGFGRLH